MFRRFLVVLTLVGAALAGCVTPPTEDVGPAATDDGMDEDWMLAEVPETITGLEPASNVGFDAGNDLAFHGPHVFVATHNNGMHVVDASDPAAAREIATVPCSGKDIGAIDFGTQVIVTISSQGDDGCPDANASGGIRLVDVTDPAAPVVLGQVPLRFGSHTHTPYGDTGFIYNSAYSLTNPREHHRSEIVDVRDPLNPVVAGELMFPDTSASHGCHDILAEPEYDRAICAGIDETMIWDATEPAMPKVMATLRNPLISIHHSVDTARNGTLLLIGDEYAGVLAPACHPVGVAPTGAIWFYTIDGYQFGGLQGFLPPPAGDAGTVCTAHNFNVIDGRDMAVAGFYGQGTLLIDFSDPTSPTVVDHEVPGGSSWATYFYKGAVFSGDGGRGLDVFLLTGDAPHEHAAAPAGALDVAAGAVRALR